MLSYQVDITSYDTFRAAVLAQASKGLGFDLDGWFGYQCWDLGQLLYIQIGRRFTTQNWLTNQGGVTSYVQTTWLYLPARNINEASPFTPVTNWSEVRRGDLCVWQAGGCNGKIGITGHNAYADQDVTSSSATITCLGQNQNGTEISPGMGQIPSLNDYFNSDGFLGAFRYTPWNGGTPTPPTPPIGYILHSSGSNFPVLLRGLQKRNSVIA